MTALTTEQQIAQLKQQLKAERKAERKIEREFVRAMNKEFLRVDAAARKAQKQIAKAVKREQVAEIRAMLKAAGLRVRDLTTAE